MVCEERLRGANPFEAGGVYRAPAVAGALDELCTMQRHFRTWFGATSLVLEGELRRMAFEAREKAWRLRPFMDLDDEALEWGESRAPGKKSVNRRKICVR